MRTTVVLAVVGLGALLGAGAAKQAVAEPPSATTTPVAVTLPAVEEGYNVIRGGEAAGKPLSNVVKVESVERIVLFQRSSSEVNHQRLFAAVLAENPNCQAWALSAVESTINRYVLLKKDGQILFVELVGGLGQSDPSALLLRGKGFGLRVPLSDKVKAEALKRD